MFIKKKHKAIIAEGIINEQKVIVAKPLTYMNNSGISVADIVKKYKIPLQNVLVIYDDLDIKKGTLRVRKEGSAGTHNGMKSIVSLLASTSFPRIRVGIGGNENSKMDTADYVLSQIDEASEPIIKDAVKRAASAVKEYISGVSIEAISQKYNATSEK